ncbi:MAG: DMT family transporter [Clostridiales bacterium]|nr:DMT family transporter [Clostridiales bacterium]
MAFVKYLFALLLFGSNGIVASFIKISSNHIVFFRTMFGSITLLIIFLFSKRKWTFYKNKKQFICLCVSGVSMGASWMFLYKAYALVGVSIATLCYYTGPVLVMIAAPFMFNEKLSWHKIVGFFIVLAGVFLISGNLNGTIEKGGILYALLSAVTYSFMVLFNKKAKNIEGIENTCLQLSISFVTVFLFLILTNDFDIVVSKTDILPLLLLGVFNTGFGCWLYFSSISKLPVQTVAVFGYTEPLSAIVFSAIILGEILLPLQFVGGVLIITGAIFAEFFFKKQQKSTLV